MSNLPKKKYQKHIQLDEDLYAKLDKYAQSRDIDASPAIRNAIKLMLSIEDPDYKKERAIKDAIELKFNIPANIPASSFYRFLYILSNVYPNADSKEFWTEMFYKSGISRTHREIFKEIKDQREILYKEYLK